MQEKAAKKRFTSLVLPNDPLSVYVKQGNLEQFINRFTYYADNLGDVYIYNMDDQDVQYPYPNVSIINVRRPSFRLFEMFKKVRDLYRLVKEKNIDFLRTPEGGNFIKSAIIGIVGKLRGKAVIVSIHGTYRGLSKTQKYKWYHKLIFRFLEEITRRTTSITFVIDPMYIEELKWENMHLIPNYVNCDMFSPEDVKKQWDGVYVGALHNRKGIPYLVEAIKKVREKFPNSKFAVIGHGPMDSLVKMIPGIDYIGPIQHETLSYYYNRSKMFITATLHEGFAIPLVEAQACDIPIVATDLPPFYNNTVPGKTSILVPSQDSTALAAGIIQLLTDTKLRKEMGHAGRAFVNRNFNRDEILKKEVALIRSVLGDSND